jgi:hypothetical protein
VGDDTRGAGEAQTLLSALRRAWISEYAGVVIGTQPELMAIEHVAVAVYWGPLSLSHCTACGAFSFAWPKRAQSVRSISVRMWAPVNGRGDGT